jgi:predicted RNase H-like HicB family nuclease
LRFLAAGFGYAKALDRAKIAIELMENGCTSNVSEISPSHT